MSENILDKFKDAPAEEKVRDMSKKVKVGIIGTGWIAEAHVKAYQKCPDVKSLLQQTLFPARQKHSVKDTALKTLSIIPATKNSSTQANATQ